MGILVTIITWGLRVAGLVSAAERIYAAFHPTSAQAQKVAEEDERQIAIAAAPPKPIDDILSRMQHGDD